MVRILIKVRTLEPINDVSARGGARKHAMDSNFAVAGSDSPQNLEANANESVTHTTR